MSGIKVIGQKRGAATGGGLALPAGDLDVNARVVTINGKAVSALIFSDSAALTGKADTATVNTALAGKQDASANLASLAGQSSTAYGRGLLNLADQTAFLGQSRSRGTLAARPAAGTVPLGFIYFANDDNGGTIYESDGVATWTKLAAGVLETGGRLMDYKETQAITNCSATLNTLTDVTGLVGLTVTFGLRPVYVEFGGGLNIQEGTTAAAQRIMAQLYCNEDAAIKQQAVWGAVTSTVAGRLWTTHFSKGVLIPAQTPGTVKTYKVQVTQQAVAAGAAAAYYYAAGSSPAFLKAVEV